MNKLYCSLENWSMYVFSFKPDSGYSIPTCKQRQIHSTAFPAHKPTMWRSILSSYARLYLRLVLHCKVILNWCYSQGYLVDLYISLYFFDDVANLHFTYMYTQEFSLQDLKIAGIFTLKHTGEFKQFCQGST